MMEVEAGESLIWGHEPGNAGYLEKPEGKETGSLQKEYSPATL